MAIFGPKTNRIFGLPNHLGFEVWFVYKPVGVDAGSLTSYAFQIKLKKHTVIVINYA